MFKKQVSIFYTEKKLYEGMFDSFYKQKFAILIAVTNNYFDSCNETKMYLIDVPMGSFFGAELCDLIRFYALNHLKCLYKDNEIGLYRDDGLTIIEKKKQPNFRKHQKENNETT